MTDDNPTADRPAQPDVAATVEAALGEHREALAVRLFLADPDRPEPGPWVSMRESLQRPYISMAQAALDYFRNNMRGAGQ